MFSARVLDLDVPAEIARIATTTRQIVLERLRRRGLVVGLSGGIDSSVVAALAVRALGPERVLGLLMPDLASADESLKLGQTMADALGVRTIVEEIAPTLKAVGCYARQTEAIRMVVPDYAEGAPFKIVLPSILASDRLNVARVTVRDEAGDERSVRLSAEANLQLVAATNFKQRVRKMLEYYHADRLHYAVAGTPNRLEYDQGFFVKQGDGAADVKPIAHLYKTQVYALAAQLGVPEDIRRRPPTTDTFPMAQTQEEFYFSLPYDKMDLCLWANNHSVPADKVAAVIGLDPGQVERVFRDIAQKRRATRYLHERPVLVEPVQENPALMCGIAGIVSLQPGLSPPAADQVSRMVSALRHRGPDEFGAFRDSDAALGHARLSIIDLTTGQQPLCNEDRTIWITFNGEIFNYLELRTELLALGHVFRTSSDTEVIVHAYESWGEQAFDRFNGQWAMALWDRRRRRLVLARDPLGVRPLYVCEHGGRLFFASEVKAIFAADPAITRAFDPVGLAQTFTFWSIVPPQGVFQGISELEPGHVRTYEGGHVTDVCVWQPTYPAEEREGFTGSQADAAAATRTVLEDATRLRVLRADVPVGSYLSGGLDSSLVAALGLRATGARFQTFSLRFEDAEYDETGYQRLMAQRLGSEHHEVVVSRHDIARVFPDVIRHTERPILRTAPAPLFLLSQLVRDAGIKVVLTGEGADEMFGGYDLFREGRVRRFWARRPDSKWRPALLSRLYPYLARSPVSQQAMARQFFGRNLAQWRSPGFAHDTRWQTTGALARLFSPSLRHELAGREVVRDFLETLPADFGRWTSLAQDQYIEVRTLLAGYLLSSQGDRMLMAHSVEGRFPFLDRNVVDFANSLPPSYKLCGLDEKHVLKRASADIVPDEILTRKKQPYRAPDALSFVGADAPPYVADAMSDRAIVDTGVFDPKGVAQLWAKCRARGGAGQFSNTDNMALVGVLSTQLLHEQFVRPRAYATDPPVSIRMVDVLSPEYRP